MKCNLCIKLYVIAVLFVIEVAVTFSAKSTGLTVVETEDIDNEHPEYTVVEESFEDPNAEEFIPTHEWQDVQKGQAIPSGLHVRLNLATGKREAKLLEPEDNQSNVRIIKLQKGKQKVSVNVLASQNKTI